jgi:uncharacterized Zn-binding protein involved in type VI secretion
MGQWVVDSALMMCTMGAAPASLVATSAPTVTVGGMPAATIMDFAPMSNIATFGMCMSLANPQVAAATAAALGVLTPQPCIPATSSPWTPGSPTVTAGGNPVLVDDDMCMCMWAGSISITFAGQATVSVGG